VFVLGKLLVGIYLGRSAFVDTYGAAASLVVVLLWGFYSAQIVLFGAEFTQVYSSKFSPRRVMDQARATEAEKFIPGESVTGLAITPNVVIVDEEPRRLVRIMDEEEAQNVIAAAMLFAITGLTSVLTTLFGRSRRKRRY